MGGGGAGAVFEGVQHMFMYLKEFNTCLCISETWCSRRDLCMIMVEGIHCATRRFSPAKNSTRQIGLNCHICGRRLKRKQMSCVLITTSVDRGSNRSKSIVCELPHLWTDWGSNGNKLVACELPHLWTVAQTETSELCVNYTSVDGGFKTKDRATPLI